MSLPAKGSFRASVLASALHDRRGHLFGSAPSFRGNHFHPQIVHCQLVLCTMIIIGTQYHVAHSASKFKFFLGAYWGDPRPRGPPGGVIRPGLTDSEVVPFR